MNEALITIGIPVKNEEHNIDSLLHNIIDQIYPHQFIEIIFVDDGCIDKTVYEIKNILSNTSISYKILFSGGKGISYSRQMIINKAKGKYILWIDADIKFKQDYIYKQVKYMENNPDVAISRGKLIMIKENYLLAKLQNLNMYLTSRKLRKSNNLFGICGSICLTEALKRVGGFDIKIKGAGEDIDLIMKLSYKWKIGKNDAVFYHPPYRNWQDLWRRSYWYGYGNHYVKSVHKETITLLNYIPLVSFMIGIKDIIQVIRLSRDFTAFFLPIEYFFQSSAWMIGYLQSHYDGYGHFNLKKPTNEQSL